MITLCHGRDPVARCRPHRTAAATTPDRLALIEGMPDPAACRQRTCAKLHAQRQRIASGTTGFPKGALLHHQGLANNGARTADRMGIAGDTVWITAVLLFHTGGCVCGVRAPFRAALRHCTHVLLEAFEPGLMLALDETYRGNAMVGVPTRLIAMPEHLHFAHTDQWPVRAICASGATVPAALVARLEAQLGAAFTNGFVQTECSPVAQTTRPDDSGRDTAGTLGAPMPHVEVKSTDPASGPSLANCPTPRSASSAAAATT